MNERFPQLAELSRENLVGLIEDAAKNWLAHDGLWFQAVERAHGLDAAIKADTEAWRKFTVVENLKTFLSPDHDIIDIDGVRVVYEDGWGLVRASNTQPVLVLRFEAASEDRLKQIQEEILGALKTVGGEGIGISEA